LKARLRFSEREAGSFVFEGKIALFINVVLEFISIKGKLGKIEKRNDSIPFFEDLNAEGKKAINQGYIKFY
jgi:hypothetical protein